MILKILFSKKLVFFDSVHAITGTQH
jgi:hypothetical protein